MSVVARALELDYDSYSKTDLSAFSDRSEISNWALPYVRAMVGADYIHGRGKILAPQEHITRSEFAQIFHNIIGSYITVKGIYDKDIKGSVLIRTDDVTFKDMTVDGDFIVGCGAADGKIVLDNVTVKGRLLVWGGGTKAVYCNNGTNTPEVIAARVDDAVKIIFDRDSTLAVIDTIKTRITERAKQHKETEIIFYDVSGLREAQKQLNAIVADNQLSIVAPAHLYAIVGETSVKAEFAQIFYNIIGTYIVSKGTYDKDIKGSVLIRTDDVELKNLTVDGDLIIGCGAADGKITLDNVTVKGRLLVWGGGVQAVYCNNGTSTPEVIAARVDDAVKIIFDRDSTLAVIDTIKARITERAKQNKETEIIFYDVSGLREAQKQLNAIVADNQIDITAPAHLYALVGESSVKAEFRNDSKGDTYKVEIRRNKDNALIADAFELAAGKSISTLTLLEAPEFGNTDCTVTITAYRDSKEIGSMQTELTLHTAYL